MIENLVIHYFFSLFYFKPREVAFVSYKLALSAILFRCFSLLLSPELYRQNQLLIDLDDL